MEVLNNDVSTKEVPIKDITTMNISTYYRPADRALQYYNTKISRYTDEDTSVYAPLVNIIKNYETARYLNLGILIQVYKFMRDTNDFWANMRRTTEEVAFNRLQKQMLSKNFSNAIQPYIEAIISQNEQNVGNIKANELQIIRLRLEATFLRYFNYLVTLLKNE
jgi:hypothetical protein